MNIPIFIPHIGCPHDCAFCNQHSITGAQSAPTPSEVTAQIVRCLAFRGKKTAEIAFFGGSFTGIDRALQDAYLAAAAPFVESGAVTGIRISTRPDYISDEILTFLRARHVQTIELGAQSMCDDVLQRCGRGHTAAQTETAAALITAYGFALGLQMMTGLPGSTREKDLYTAQSFVRLHPTCARIYPTVVLGDTHLAAMLAEGTYTSPTLEETVALVADILQLFRSADISVIRMGLQEAETMRGAVLGGVYHPAFGELVWARLYRNALETFVSAHHSHTITVTCPSSEVSKLLGQHRDNARYLQKKYGADLHISPAPINEVRLTDETSATDIML